jgi:hypothetical protein
MTRIVDDAALDGLYNALNAMGVIVERMRDGNRTEAYRYASVMNTLRQTINRWPKIPPMEDELGHKRELVDSDFIGECGEHGLFWRDDQRRKVMDTDCPACEREQNRKDAENA